MNNLNIVIPMAGEGRRFVEAGFIKAKPFIEVHGKPMIRRVMENLYCPMAKFILITQEKHFHQEKTCFDKLEEDFNVTVLTIPKTTEGTACTVLRARELINNKIPLLIANSDQMVDISIFDFIKDALERKLDGSILTFTNTAKDPKWSFARINERGLVTEVKEKVAISEFATVGIYFFSQGKFFVDGVIDMIVSNDRVNGEFYTCPVYNYLLASGKRIGSFNITKEQMHGLGVPSDLKIYVEEINSQEPCLS